MEPLDPGGPRTFPLQPRGPERSPNMIDLCARAGGTLVGAVVDGSFQTWLQGPGGHLTLVVWPGGFSARVDDLQFDVLDERGDRVAKGGELITIGGGFLLKAGDPRRLGHERVFITSARQVSRAPDEATDRPVATK